MYLCITGKSRLSRGGTLEKNIYYSKNTTENVKILEYEFYSIFKVFSTVNDQKFYRFYTLGYAHFL